MTILVGTASWTDKSLIDSGKFYPRTANDAESRLRYYASQFSMVEIDSSYYAIPLPATGHFWAERTPEHFNLQREGISAVHRAPNPAKGFSERHPAGARVVTDQERLLPRSATRDTAGAVAAILRSPRATASEPQARRYSFPICSLDYIRRSRQKACRALRESHGTSLDGGRVSKY